MLLCAVPVMAADDLLDNILNGTYNPKTLTVGAQDTLLGDTLSRRYQLQKENEQKIFRHSFQADYYVYDTQRQSRKQIGGGPVREVTVSPNGRYVAFVKDQNIYIHKLDFGTEVAVTTTTDPFIFNGLSDWLYEEEFGQTTLMAFSPDSKQLAFIRLDERRVPVHYWERYLDGTYPVRDSLYYPKAGQENARASVWVYDIKTKQTREVDLGRDTTQYIPRVRWSNPVIERQHENDRAGELIVQTVNRDQTKMTVYSGNARSTVMHPLYTEQGRDNYIDYSLFDDWQWLQDNRIIVLSEKDGWRGVYLASQQGTIVRRLSQDGMDVTQIVGVDETTGTVYYIAAPTPETRQVYAVSLRNGTPKQLTTEAGMHTMRLSKDGKQAIICYQSFTQPNRYTLYSVNGTSLKAQRVLEDNAAVREAWLKNRLPEPELLKIPNAQGKSLEAMLLRSQQPTANSQQPLIIMHYSGPASQRVLNRWRKRFEYALVDAGYAVLIVDPRGSDCKGRAWRNETYMQLGQKEAEDLIAAAKWAGQQAYIDSTRLGIIGWSYGGYETIMTMCQPGHPFRAGIAIAPVTDWRLYDSGYTERYMRRPQVNYGGYDQSDLTRRAKDLRGELLIIHGTADDNVHVQNTMVLTEAFVEAGKQFEMQLYTDDNHHLRARKNARHMHERMLVFLKKNL